jgi:hypothetical protein
VGLEVLMLVVVVFGALLGSEAWPAVCGCVSCVCLVCGLSVLLGYWVPAVWVGVWVLVVGGLVVF